MFYPYCIRFFELVCTDLLFLFLLPPFLPSPITLFSNQSGTSEATGNSGGLAYKVSVLVTISHEHFALDEFSGQEFFFWLGIFAFGLSWNRNKQYQVAIYDSSSFNAQIALFGHDVTGILSYVLSFYNCFPCCIDNLNTIFQHNFDKTLKTALQSYDLNLFKLNKVLFTQVFFKRIIFARFASSV